MTFQRILIKISGEALSGTSPDQEGQNFGLSPDMVSKVVGDLRFLKKEVNEIAVVVGGGNFHRGLRGKNGFTLNRVASDSMGMLATVMNGIALCQILEDDDIPARVMCPFSLPSMVETYGTSRALDHMAKGRVVIFAGGTGNPFFTTDTAAALRAIEIKADCVLKATKTKGVYTQDPAVYPEAQFLPTLSYHQALNQNLAVMDMMAFTLLKDAKIPLIVFSIYEKDALLRVVSGDLEHTFVS